MCFHDGLLTIMYIFNVIEIYLIIHLFFCFQGTVITDNEVIFPITLNATKIRITPNGDVKNLRIEIFACSPFGIKDENYIDLSFKF